MAKIDGSLSKEVVEFEPGGSPGNFEVYVINKSDRFASFRVELFAAGSDPNIGHRWYQLNPEVSAVKPPGDKTIFSVDVIETPIPGVETINVTVQVSSLDFRDIFRLSLRLKIKAGVAPSRLLVELPVPNRSLYPREQIEIPVRVTNPDRKNADVVLKFTGIESNWLNRGTERRLLVGAGRANETSFSCQPPIAIRAPSKKYPFQVVAYLQGKPVGSAAGTLEILPVGSVFFNCEPLQHWLPTKNYWWIDWRSQPVSYLLEFKNSSNLFQNIWIDLKGKKVAKLTWQSLPEGGKAAPGETLPLELKVGKKRHWLGLTQKFTLEAISNLSDGRLGKADPPSQNLELRIHPIVPLWMQLLAALLALLLSLFLLTLSPVQYHTAKVNSVSFSGVVDPVVSGSDDRTVRYWEVTPDRFGCKWLKSQRYCLKSNGILIESTGKDGTGEKAVRVLRFRAEKTDELAVGLENGEILFWDVNLKQKVRGTFVEQRSDRVLALEFSKNSQYLFSGHGGQLWQWNLDNPTLTNSLFKLNDANRFAIFTLALSQDERTLIIAGRYNKILLGNWDDKTKLPKFRDLGDYPKGAFGDYVESIATIKNTLVTADTQGFIRIWNLSECRENPDTCTPTDSWQITYKSSSPMPIRSIDLTKDGAYLISAGDDGTIRLWQIDETTMQRNPEYITGQKIAKYPTRINSVDAIIRDNRLLIVSGGDDYQVRLNTYSLNTDR